MYPELIRSVLVQRATFVRYEDIMALRTLFKQLSPVKKDFSPERVNGLIRTCGGNVSLFLALDKEKDARPVGMASLIEISRLRETHGLIEDVVVEEGYRRKGIGRALIKIATETAKTRGYTQLTLTSSSERGPAQKFYASLGFKLRNTNHWRLSLV